MTNLIEVKKKKRAKNPDFLRSDAHKKKRLKTGWRSARGHHNKMRLVKRGYRRLVKSGYGTPATLRDFETNGIKKITISNLNDLSKVNPKTECAIISNVGLKRKIELVKEAIKRKIIIFNVKKPEEFLKLVEEGRKKQAEEKKKAELAKKEKEKVKEKTKQEVKKKEETTEELNEEEKQEQERKEKEKVIIKKQ